MPVLWEDVLVPVRFLATMGQLVGTLAVGLDMRPYLLPALPRRHTEQQYHDAEEECMQVVVLSLVFLSLEVGSLMLGFSFFSSKANMLHCLFHGAGFFAVMVFSAASNHFGVLWYIFWFCAFPTLLVEAHSLLGLFWLRRAAY
mmetsp:Transcript_129462/g.374946  ORF Transcript_129462/g.374946 Transcript_129462/m.374946 type:complete len:143 (-) Transcript_129462:82-510(-)